MPSFDDLRIPILPKSV